MLKNVFGIQHKIYFYFQLEFIAFLNYKITIQTMSCCERRLEQFLIEVELGLNIFVKTICCHTLRPHYYVAKTGSSSRRQSSKSPTETSTKMDQVFKLKSKVEVADSYEHEDEGTKTAAKRRPDTEMGNREVKLVLGSVKF